MTCQALVRPVLSNLVRFDVDPLVLWLLAALLLLQRLASGRVLLPAPKMLRALGFASAIVTQISIYAAAPPLLAPTGLSSPLHCYLSAETDFLGAGKRVRNGRPGPSTAGRGSRCTKEPKDRGSGRLDNGLRASRRPRCVAVPPNPPYVYSLG